MAKIVIDGLEIETERQQIPFPVPKHNGWISVEYMLPPEKHEVLYFAIMDGGNQREIMTGHREGELWTHCCMFYSTRYLSELVKVTHWMELPDYPKIEQSDLPKAETAE